MVFQRSKLLKSTDHFVFYHILHTNLLSCVFNIKCFIPFEYIDRGIGNRIAHSKARILTENPNVTECSRVRVYAVFETGQGCDCKWGFLSFWAAVFLWKQEEMSHERNPFSILHHMLHFLPPFFKTGYRHK